MMCRPQILDYIRVENIGRVKNVGRCHKMSEGCLGQIKGVKTSEECLEQIQRMKTSEMSEECREQIKRVKMSETSEECREQIKRVKTSEDIGRHWKTSENVRRMSAEVGSKVGSKYGM